MKTQASKLIIVVIFLVVALVFLVYQFSGFTAKQPATQPIQQNSAPPPNVQPGVIQHVITKLDPVVPSGKVLEVKADSGKSIQSLIDSANPGDTILLKNGTYSEQLNLKDGIILKGEDSNSVIIQTDMRMGPVLKIENCRSVKVSNLTLKNFNQLSEKLHTHGNWALLHIENSGASLDHLIICDSSAEGVKITNDGSHLDHVIMSDCTIYNNYTSGILVLGNGNVELINNTCIYNKKSGICFENYTDGVVTGNICKSNSYHGISILDNASADLAANTCAENKMAGIMHGSNSPFNVKDSNCFDNGTSGIEVRTQVKAEIAGNNCARNAVNGIYLLNGVSGNVNNNVCSQNKWHGISIEKTCVPRVDNNKCFKNQRCGIYNDWLPLGPNIIYDNNEFCQPEIQALLSNENFDQLEKMAAQMRAEKKRFSNGNWQLNYFYSAFEIGYDTPKYQENINYIEKWIAKYPASVTPMIAKAICLNWQGWSIRGYGYSNTVSPKSWKPFEQSLEQSLAVLKEAEKLNVKDPVLYSTWVNVAMGLGKKDDLETAFKKGIEIDPTFFPLYNVHNFAYLPKWYGEPGQYEKLAAQAADSTKAQLGDSLYFLLAMEMTSQVEDVNQFIKSGFDFNRVKQGQNDFAKQFPDCMDIGKCNKMCYMACAAGDKESARDYFLDVGDQWQEKPWQNVETFKKYKSWARHRDLIKN